jgi:hypothetical protein
MMGNVNTTPEALNRESALEQSRLRRYAEKMEEIDNALRREAAALREWARALEASDSPLAEQMHQGAIRIDTLAWEIRSFDPDDPAVGHEGLAARAGSGSLPTVHQRDSGSGEGTRTDLGGGPEGTDTKGTGVTD